MMPSTYWIGGVLAATLSDIQVQCGPAEAAMFNPPPGQTCGQYAQSYVNQRGTGYITNPTATSDCGYCPYSNGVEYMATINVNPSDKWKYLPIFLGFVFSNWLLVYFFVYTVRVKGWGFGLGYVFGGLGKLVGAAKAGFGKIFGGNKKEGEVKTMEG
jgi:ABC-type multidrug transport system permease subunit